ncbi:MAG: MCE family protein [Chlorobi bacterium]|nr:MCE family protein [Chlorobiota bacterium]
MTKEKARIVKTGILFVVILLITIWGVNYVKSNDLLSAKVKLHGIYSDVAELSVGNHVYVSGTKIGKVAHINFIEGNLEKLDVEFHIKKNIKIPKGSIAKITSIDLLGTKGIEIILKKNTNGGFYKNNDTLKTAVETSLSEEVNKQIMPLKIKTENMVGTLDSLLVAFRAVFNPKTRRNIKQSFDHIQKTLRNLESSSVLLDKIMVSGKDRVAVILKNAESITTNLEKNNDNIEKILQNFGDISDSLAAANFVGVIDNADKSLDKFNKIMNKIEKGEGTIGLLLKDEELYNKLEKASNDLDKLFIDIKENPKRYVRFSAFSFGKKVYVTDTDSIPED